MVQEWIIEDDVLELNEEFTKNEPLITPKVTTDTEDMRLDKFLVHSFPGYSRNQMIRFITAGCVKNAETDAFADEADMHVKLNEQYVVTPPQAVPAEPVAEKMDLDILYEDSDVLVVNKPAGVVVHPGAGNYAGTLVNGLLAYCGDSLSGIGGVKRPGIVHRIDKDTSGILVVAKNDYTHVRLSEQFSQHTIERIYQAFVWGFVQKEMGVVVGNIGRSTTNRQKMAIVHVGGKMAVTHYERLGSYQNGLASFVKCVLETGRTHQIRVHMASIGHSLIGDSVYGLVPRSAPEYLRFFPRQALHAGFLGFIHPRTGRRLAFETPLPEDLQKLKIFLEKTG